MFGPNKFTEMHKKRVRISTNTSSDTNDENITRITYDYRIKQDAILDTFGVDLLISDADHEWK